MNSNKLKLRGSIMLLCMMASSLLPLFAVTSGGFAKITHSENRVVVTTQQELLEYLTCDEAYTIYVRGDFTFTEPCRVSSNKALIGTASISGQGFIVENVSNVLIEGINLSGVEGEAIKIKKGAKHVWVNHCSFVGNENPCIRMCPGADSVTISGNRFQGCKLACKIGYGSIPAAYGVGLSVTIHDNYFMGVEEQCVDVRRSPICDIYGGQLDSDGVYVTATMGAKVSVGVDEMFIQWPYDESDYFINQVGNLEKGYIKTGYNSFGGENVVPTPTYKHEDLMVDDMYHAYLPQYNSGASYAASAYNSAADYDGVGVKNSYHMCDYLQWYAYHSGRALHISDTPKSDSSYAFIQGSRDYMREEYFYNQRGEAAWYNISTSGMFYESPDPEMYMTVVDGGEIVFTTEGRGSVFRVQRVTEDLSRVICMWDEKCLEVEDASMDSGAVVRLATCEAGKTNQMFYHRNPNRGLLNATGIVEPISDAEISVYPNPANSELNIAVPESMLDKAYSVEIVNAIGQKVFERAEMEGEINTIDIGNLSSGMYWVKLVSGKQIISKKLIKN